MKRMRVHVSVEDIAQSIRFYSTLTAGACCTPKQGEVA
jgi:hypothetical protein